MVEEMPCFPWGEAARVLQDEGVFAQGHGLLAFPAEQQGCVWPARVVGRTGKSLQCPLGLFLWIFYAVKNLKF